ISFVAADEARDVFLQLVNHSCERDPAHLELACDIVKFLAHTALVGSPEDWDTVRLMHKNMGVQTYSRNRVVELIAGGIQAVVYDVADRIPVI
ncbi:hypothetical protein, partial [Helicobacter pylori]|uniref:hypothetical protein n=1 Tax=Helicobacter pylori TaxID=210 RepID=UPI002929D0A8